MRIYEFLAALHFCLLNSALPSAFGGGDGYGEVVIMMIMMVMMIMMIMMIMM